MPNYRWEIADSAAAVNWDDWVTVCHDPSEVTMDLRFLQATEDAMRDVSETRYLIGYDENGNPVACTCLTRFWVDGAILSGPGHRNLINAVRKIYPRYMKFRVFFCGLPVSVGTSYLRIAEDHPQETVVESLETEMERLAAEQRSLAVVWKEFNNAECDSLNSLTSRGYLKADSLPMNTFESSHSDFDEFCGEMRSHYRYKIKKSKKKFDKAGLRVEHITDPERIEQLYTPEVHELYLAVLDHAEHRLETLPREFFLNLLQEMPKEISFTAVFHEDRVVAFAWGLHTGEHYRDIFVGFDYDLNHRTDLYFNLMMRDMDYGIRTGSTHVFMGQSSDDFKSRLGCVQQPLSIYVKLRNKTFNWCMHKLASVVFPPHEGAPVRDLLKADAPTETSEAKQAVARS